MRAGGRSGCRVGLAVLTATPVLALAFVSPASGADVFTVDSTKDKLDASTADNICATAGGHCTLRAAITQANVDVDKDLINVPKGTFELTRKRDTPAGNEEGDLEILEAVTIDGVSPGKTIIEQTVKDRVLGNDANGLPGVNLSDLTLTGGRRVQAQGGPGGGGVLNEQDAILSLDRVVIRGNRVLGPGGSANGGGISQQTDGILLIADSAIRRNLARTNLFPVGGGIFARGILSIERSRVSGNAATARNPVSGAFPAAGGIEVIDTATITDSTIAGNTATGGPLAAGGGILSSLDSDLDLVASTIARNRARQGGGLYGIRAAITAENSTFSGNSDSGGGGAAIYEASSGGSVAFTHTTIAQNVPSSGHAAVEADANTNADSLTFYGSIIAGRGTDCGGKLDAFDVDEQNVFGDAVCSPGISTDRIANPLLKDLADNGGPTRTHALKASSPAIDLVSVGQSLPTDQRGLPREFQGSDAGSFERQ